MKTNITTPVGTFSKGKAGSVAINFAPSAGSLCSKECEYKRNGKCYAVATEKRKSSITVNLERKESHPAEYLDILAHETAQPRIQSAPWVRFSAFGGVYDYSQLPAGAVANFGEIAHNLKPLIQAGRVHFPTETVEKYTLYRELGFPTRLSLQTQALERVIDEVFAGRVVSCSTVGEKIYKRESQIKANIREAQRIAEYLRELGISVVVCGAIANRKRKIKCGDCTACGRDKVQVVIYPEH